MARAMTLRLDEPLADDLDMVAAVDGQPVSEIIRAAVADHVRARQADPKFQAGLRRYITRARRMLGEDTAA